MRLLYKRNFSVVLIFVMLLTCQPKLWAVSDGNANFNASFQQDRTIRVVGKVTEPDGYPAVGVSIAIMGTTIGTITNADGHYVVDVDPDAELTVSYIGFKNQQIKVNGRTSIDVVLEAEELMLEEVVISVGYGTQRKVSTIGSQSGIADVRDLKQPVANLTNVIAGRVSGVVGVQRSGEPGNDRSDIWIRGISTFSNNSPLILVDGVERDFSNIDAEDIESFQILKDASATAVYGVKGANGVIMVTTKRGRKGKPKIRAEYNMGITEFTQTPNLADGITYMQMANEAMTTRGSAPLYSEEKIRRTYTGEDPYLYPNVQWMDEIFNDYGRNKKMNVNASGGSEFAQYYVSVGFYDEQGMYKVNNNEQYDASINFQRYNFTTNLTMQVSPTTEVNLGIKGYSSKRKAPHYSANDVFKMALNTYPILYPADFYPGGYLPYTSTGGGLLHPYGMLTRYGYRTQDNNQTYADLRIAQDLDIITKGLTLRGLYSFDNHDYYQVRRSNTSPIVYYIDGRDEDGELILKRTDNSNGKEYLDFSRDISGNRRYYLEASLNYERVFEKHRVGGLFLYNQTDYLNKGADNLISSQPYRSLGIAGRGTYSYNDKYLFEANFGYNGSENFAPNKRFGFFPSIGAGWVVSNEAFFMPLKGYVQFLKFRITHGQTGNDNLGGSRRFAYISTVDDGGGGYKYGKNRDNTYDGYNIKDYAVDVTWETSTKQNFGIDLHTFDSNLVLQVDFFKDRREDIFLKRASVPDYIGVRNQDFGNLGIIDNKGYEVSLDWSSQIGDWFLGLKGNYSFSQSEIIEDDTPGKPYPWLETRGLPRHHRFGYVFEGFYTEQEIETMRTQNPDNKVIPTPVDFDPASNNYLAGDLKYKDLNGDGMIDENDQKSIGYDQVPQIVYGFGANVSWRNFSIGAFFQGVAKCDISTLVDEFIPFRNAAAKGNVYGDIVNRWTPENQGEGAIWPRLNYGGKINQNYESSTFWLHDGSFLRLKTVDFGYTLPKQMTKKMGIENVRVYFLGNNLLTFSGFDRYDVELGSGSGTSYPNIKTYSLGCSVNF